MRLPPTPCRVCFRPCVFNKFSHFWQKETSKMREQWSIYTAVSRPQREHARLRAPHQLEAAVGAPLGVRPLRVSIPVPPRREAPLFISPGVETASREKYVFEGDRRPSG